MTVKEKAKMARKKGLGGVFLWEAGQDLPSSSKASLLYALALERNRMLGAKKKGKREEGIKALKNAAAKVQKKSGTAASTQMDREL